MTACREDPQINFRMPQTLKDDLEQIAEETKRSRNSQILVFLEDSVESYKNEKALNTANVQGFNANTTTV